MRSAVVLVLRCGLAVTVTTAAVQLWSMALQDDVPLPAPILALPVTDDAVAAVRPKPVPIPTRPAVVVSAQLLARATRPPRPTASPRHSEPAPLTAAPPSVAPLRSPSPVVLPPPPPPPPAPEPEPAPAPEDPPLSHHIHVPPLPLHPSAPPHTDPHDGAGTAEEDSGAHDQHGGSG